MSILLDNIVFELQRKGGISLLWAKLAAFLCREPDIECRFVEGPSARENLFRSVHAADLAPLIPDHRLPLRIRRYLPIREEFGDVFHSSYFRISRNPRHRQVVTVHDMIYERFDRGINRAVHLRQKVKSLRHADAIICVSENTKQDLLEHYPFIDERITRVVPNGVDSDFHILPRRPDRASVCGREVMKYGSVLYVGQRVLHKGFPTALRVIESRAARDAGLNLLVVGGGAVSPAEKREISRRNLEDRVTFLPTISTSDLNLLFNMAYCLVFPSLYEGFGIPPLEAMRAGCPVVASNCSSIPEVVGDAGVLCSPGDVDEFSAALGQFGDSRSREDWIRRGSDRASRFSWNSTCEQTTAVYRSLL